jgi:hypothetical protein
MFDQQDFHARSGADFRCCLAALQCGGFTNLSWR